MNKLLEDNALSLAEKVGSLRGVLWWILTHSHECLDDHPATLAHIKKVYNSTGYKEDTDVE